MNAFGWLLVGHLIGDWLLQNDWMASGKKQSFFSLAGMTHFGLYTVVITSMLWIFCGSGQSGTFYLAAGATVFFSHWLIDATSIVERWMKFYGQDPTRDFMRIIIDQTLHVIILALISLICGF
jgi:hypothetical protein